MMLSSFHRTAITLFMSVSVVLCLLLPSIAFAEEPAVIENIKLANTRDDLLTYSMVFPPLFRFILRYIKRVTHGLTKKYPTSGLNPH